MKTTQLPRRFLLPALLLTVLAAPAQPAGDAPPGAPAVTVVQPAVGKLPADFKPSPALQPLITLVQSGVSEEVLLAYLASAGTRIALTPEEIIFLRDLGVGDAILTQLLGAPAPADPAATASATASTPPAPLAPANAPAPAAPAVAAMDAAPPAPAGVLPEVVVPPAQPVTTNQFVESLAPYGNWVNVDGYGLAWQPTVVVINQSWRPYADNGRWVWSNCGWYWASDYSWGWAPFHYGRWVSHASYRWVWCPGTQWGPSWVSWRYSPSYCGWAPLPPTAHYRSGVGFTYRSQSVGIHFEFGLGSRDYCYVPTTKFCHPRPVTCAVPYDRVHAVHQTTSVVNNYIHNEHNVVINRGISPDAVALISKTEVPRVEVVPGRIGTGRGAVAGAGRQFPDGTRLTSGRPARDVTPGASRTLPPPAIAGTGAGATAVNLPPTTGGRVVPAATTPAATPAGSVRGGMPPGGRSEARPAGNTPGQTIHTVTRGPGGLRPSSRPEPSPVTAVNTPQAAPAPTGNPTTATPATPASTPVAGRTGQGQPGSRDVVLTAPQGNRYVPPSPMVTERRPPTLDARLSNLSPRGATPSGYTRPATPEPVRPSAPVASASAPSAPPTPQVPRATLPVTATSPGVQTPAPIFAPAPRGTVDARLSHLSPRPASVPAPSPSRIEMPTRPAPVPANIRSLSPSPVAPGNRILQPGSLERFRTAFPSASPNNGGGAGRSSGANGGSRFVPPTPATGQ